MIKYLPQICSSIQHYQLVNSDAENVKSLLIQLLRMVLIPAQSFGSATVFLEFRPLF